AIILDDTPLPDPIRYGLLAGLAALSAAAIVLLFVQRRGMFAPALRLSERLGLSARAPELMRRLQHLDEEIASVHANGNGALGLSVASFFVGWCMGVVE